MATAADEQAKLIRLFTNYTLLSQFELARAALLDLYRLNPQSALRLLKSVVSDAHKIEGMLDYPVESRAHLIWLCVLELSRLTPQDCSLAFEEADFTLLLFELTTLFRKFHSNERDPGLGNSDTSQDAPLLNSASAELQDTAPDTKDSQSNAIATFSENVRTLLHLLSYRSAWGLPECNKIVNSGQRNFFNSFFHGDTLDSMRENDVSLSDYLSSQVEPASMKELIRMAPDVICALSRNASRQLAMENSESLEEEKATSTSTFHTATEPVNEIPATKKNEWMQTLIEKSLIELIVDLLKKNEFTEACKYLEYTNSDLESVPSLLYSNMFSYFLGELKKNENDLLRSQSMLTKLHESTISSGSHYLLTLLESEEDNEAKSSGNPLERVHALICMHNDSPSSNKIDDSDFSTLSETYKRKMYHYARTNGKHVLACALDTALSAIEHLDFKKTFNVLIPYPKLCSVVVAMGWDLLSQNLEGRRNLMATLWTNDFLSGMKKKKDYYNCELTFSLLGLQPPTSITYEASCIDNLCDELCYRLEMANRAALYMESSYLTKENTTPFQNFHPISDNNFISGLVVENLAILSPIKIIFDVMPMIDVDEAIQLVLKQPDGGKSHFLNLKMWDVELLNMLHCIQLSVNVFNMKDIDNIFTIESSRIYLKRLEKHLSNIVTPMRKTWIIIFLVDLLQMDLSIHISKSSYPKSTENQDVMLTAHEFNSQSTESKSEISHPAIDFMQSLLLTLLRHIPSPAHEADKSNLIAESMDERHGQEERFFGFNDDLENESEYSERVSRYAWEKRGNVLRNTLKDWEWRLAILRRMPPSPNRSWKWNEILTVLLAAPTTLLHICVQRAQYALGEEAVQHFSLPTEEAVSLQLAQWVDDAVTRASVDGAISRVAKGSSNSEASLNLSALYSRLPPLASVILCLDVAVASARSSSTTNRLLDQAKSLFVKCENSEDLDVETTNNNKGKKEESTSIHNSITYQVAKALLKQLQDIQNQGDGQPLQQLLSAIDYSHPQITNVREKPNLKYILSLQTTIEDSIEGKSQFICGKLHNFAKAFAGDLNLEDNNSVISSLFRRNDISKQMKKVKFEIGVGLQRYIPSTQSALSISSDAVTSAKETNSGTMKNPSTSSTTFTFFPPSGLKSDISSLSSSSSSPSVFTSMDSLQPISVKEPVSKTTLSVEIKPNNEQSMNDNPSPSSRTSTPPSSSTSSENIPLFFPALKFIVGTSSSVQKRFLPFLSTPSKPSFPITSSTSLPPTAVSSTYVSNNSSESPKVLVLEEDSVIMIDSKDGKKSPRVNKKGLPEKSGRPLDQAKVIPAGQNPTVSKPNPFLTHWKGLGNQKGLLAAFVHYVVSIGDVVDEIEDTPNFNYFSLIYERPNDLLTRLVFSRKSASSASMIASIMDVDLVHQVISSSVPPIYPFDPSLIQNQFYLQDPTHLQIKDFSNLYPLRLDVVKHLFSSSPIRAILACVFGTKNFISLFSPVSPNLSANAGESIEEEQPLMSDSDETFQEFALSQSSQYPPLQRWIDLQTHIINSDTNPMNATKTLESTRFSTKIKNKRLRTDEEETKDKEKNNVIETEYKPKRRNVMSGVGFCNLFVEKENKFFNENTPDYFFDWNNEGYFYESMERKIESGQIFDALNLSNTWLENGAPDHLLQQIIEGSLIATDPISNPDSRNLESQTYAPCNTWQFCLRMNDKELAASLSLRCLENWSLENATMALEYFVSILPFSSSLYNEVLEKKRILELFGRIMQADKDFIKWTQVKSFCENDPEGLALRMAEKGEIDSAVEIALSFDVRVELRQELQGFQLSMIMKSSPLQGGGSSEGIRYLNDLPNPEDCIQVVMGAISQLSSLHSKEILVWYLLNSWERPLSEENKNLLTRMALGLRMLHSLPGTWQVWCNPIYNHPHLILETLLMSKQLQSAEQLLQFFPGIQNDSLIMMYASKALILPPVSTHHSSSVIASTHSVDNGKQSPSQRDIAARSLWGGREDFRSTSKKSRDFQNQSTPLESPSGRKSDYPDAQGVDLSQEKWLLSGDSIKDDSTRKSHSYKNVPNAALFESLMNLCTSSPSTVKSAFKIIIEKVESNLVVDRVPSDEFFDMNLAPIHHAANTYSQALKYMKERLLELSKSNELSPRKKKTQYIQSPSNSLKSNKFDKSQDLSDFSSSISIQISNDPSSLPFFTSPSTSLLSDDHFYEFVNQNMFNYIETSDSQFTKRSMDLHSEIDSDFDLDWLMSETNKWLGRVELMDLLLSCGIPVSISDFFNENVNLLIERLIRDEKYKFAIIVCIKCQVNSVSVWKSWGQALLCIQKYQEARQKFEYALQLSHSDTSEIISHILLTLENAFPSDVNSARIKYNRVKQYVNNSLQDALSSESYLDLLADAPLSLISYQYSQMNRAEYDQNNALDANGVSKIFNSHNPHPHLDRVCYYEALFYLNRYSKQDMITFIFRHGQYMDACNLFFPHNSSAQVNLSSSLSQLSSSPSLSTSVSFSQPSPLSLSPKRLEPYSTEFGTLDDLCRLCVAYDCVNILENVIVERLNPDHLSSPYASSISDLSSIQIALTKICSYFETHRHFHHLYRFQKLQKDPVAAGLTCIQLFLNSTSFAEALLHLENAKVHFDEGRTARQLAMDMSMGSIRSRTGKGKVASSKLSEEELIKLKLLSELQMEILQVGKHLKRNPYEFSLFGNPNEPETIKRRCEVAEILVERNSDLAFNVIIELGLPASQIYAGVIASLAAARRNQDLWTVLRSIRGTISNEDWDQVVGVAIKVYIQEHKERPDKLIEQLSSPHWKVIYYVACNRLKLAFQIASSSKNENDVLFVYNEAKQNKSVRDMCHQWLAANHS